MKAMRIIVPAFALVYAGWAFGSLLSLAMGVFGFMFEGIEPDRAYMLKHLKELFLNGTLAICFTWDFVRRWRAARKEAGLPSFYPGTEAVLYLIVAGAIGAWTYFYAELVVNIWNTSAWSEIWHALVMVPVGFGVTVLTLWESIRSFRVWRDRRRLGA